MNTTALAVGGRAAGIIPQTFEDVQRVAKTMIAAGLGSFVWNDDEQTKLAKATAQIMTGLELGVPPMQAMANIAVINGKPMIYGELAPALILRAGHVYHHWIEGEGDERVAVATIKRKSGEEYRQTFSAAQAKAAGLWDERATVKRYDRKKSQWIDVPNDSPWFRYRDDMLRWKACARVCKEGAADVLKGIAIREDMMGDVDGSEPEAVYGGELVVEEVSPRDGGEIAFKGEARKRPSSSAFKDVGGQNKFNRLTADIEGCETAEELQQCFDSFGRDGVPWFEFPVGWARLLQETYHYKLEDLRKAAVPADDGAFLRAINAAPSREALTQLWQEASDADREAHEAAFLDRLDGMEAAA